ncbi:MAG: ABC transporter ATP-binding protein [Deltaproteobacteria bacterium]|nr:ABC transporter ATP-binding protein [Deltaproteobacteria bacterium]
MIQDPVCPALEVRGLTRRYGSRTVVEDLSIRVEAGDLHGFLGPNGAGKTTTLRCILGLIHVDAGEISIFGETDPVARRRTVGAVVETPRFHEWMSGRANLEESAAYLGREADVDDALHRVGLQDRAGDLVKAYSHGMRQRLGLARALLGRPRLLLLDEPTGGLDPRGMREVRDLLRLLVRQDGLTVFLSSHLLAEVEALCNRVSILDRGRLVAQEDVSVLLERQVTDEVVEVGAEDCGRLRQALADLPGVEITGTGEAGRTLVALHQMTPAELNRSLLAAGVAVSALVPKGPRLEDLYLESVRSEDRS